MAPIWNISHEIWLFERQDMFGETTVSFSVSLTINYRTGSAKSSRRCLGAATRSLPAVSLLKTTLCTYRYGRLCWLGGDFGSRQDDQGLAASGRRDIHADRRVFLHVPARCHPFAVRPCLRAWRPRSQLQHRLHATDNNRSHLRIYYQHWIGPIFWIRPPNYHLHLSTYPNNCVT